jgi:hypothetical protein
MGPSRLKKRTDGVDVDLDNEHHRFEFYMVEKTEHTLTPSSKLSSEPRDMMPCKQ